MQIHSSFEPKQVLLSVREAFWPRILLFFFLLVATLFLGAFTFAPSMVLVGRVFFGFFFLMNLLLTIVIGRDSLRFLRSLSPILFFTESSLWMALQKSGKLSGEYLEILYSEIVFAEKTVESRIGFSKQDVENVYEKFTYLTLELKQVLPLVIEASINQAVQKESDNKIRIGWRTKFVLLTPCLKKAVRVLKPFVTFKEDQKIKWQPSRELSEDAVKARALKLYREKDKISAMKLLRSRLRYSYEEAISFLEKSEEVK